MCIRDSYNIFHSLIHSGLSTTVDFYIILADDNELNYFIDNIVELAFLSQSHGVKLSHKKPEKDIYCISYDIFIVMFDNLYITPDNRFITSLKDVFSSWKVLH